MYRTILLIIAILMSAISSAHDSQSDGSTEERLSNLEEDVAALGEEQSAFFMTMQDAMQLTLYGTLEYVVTEAARLRFGVILVSFGEYNLKHFDTTRDLTDRPIVMRRVVPVTWAEAGAGLTGQVTLPKASGSEQSWMLNYSAFFVNGLTNDLTDTSIRNASGGFGSDNNNNKALVGRVGLAPSPNLEIGLSGYRGKLGSESNDSILGLAVDLEYRRGRYEFLGELARFDLDDGFEVDGITARLEFYSGHYLQAGYHFWRARLNNTFMDRSFRNSVLTASVRYGAVTIDDDGAAGTGDNEEKRITLGLNYRPTETFVFKFEYQYNMTDNESLERGDRNGFVFSPPSRPSRWIPC